MAADREAASATAEGRDMLRELGWTDERQGALPLGLVRAMYLWAC